MPTTQAAVQISAIVPTLTVDDSQKSIALYEALGFAIDQRWEDKGTLLGVMLRAGKTVENRGPQFGVGVGVTLPFLEWNRIRQRILAADTTAEIAVADYERTALSALEETERAISAYVQERERFGHLDRAARSARAAANLARQRYLLGVDTFLTVLDAERVRLDAEDQLAQSRVKVTRQAAIFKALGGGWSEAERLTSAQLDDDDRERLQRIVEVGRRQSR